MASTDLGKWMITNGGKYDPAATYEQLTMVMHNNSAYITLKTVTGAIPDDDGVNYMLMAQGFDVGVLENMTAKDTSGVAGTVGKTVNAQSLIDAIADKVMTKLIAKTQIVNSLLATDPDTVLAGPMGKQLKDDLDRLNSDMAGIKFKEIALPVGSTIESDLLKFNTTDFGISGVGVNYIVRTFTGFDSFIIGNISSSNNYGSQLLVKDSDIIKYRSKYDGAWGDWKQLAFK